MIQFILFTWTTVSAKSKYYFFLYLRDEIVTEKKLFLYEIRSPVKHSIPQDVAFSKL